MSPLQIGDKVTLNDEGLRVIYGHAWRSMGHMKSLVMKITEIDPVSYTYPEESHIVHVDNPFINEYQVMDYCFDKA